jgi:uncharacterized coiled-coil protein SlyX
MWDLIQKEMRPLQENMEENSDAILDLQIDKLKLVEVYRKLEEQVDALTVEVGRQKEDIKMLADQICEQQWKIKDLESQVVVLEKCAMRKP